MRVPSLVLFGAAALPLAVVLPARAGDTELPLNDPEKAAFCVIETGIAVVADVIEQQGCEAVRGRYELDVDIAREGAGFAQLDNLDLQVALVRSRTKGEKWEVTGTGDFNNLPIDPINGYCQNSRDADIIIGRGNLKIDGHKYRWKFIKDVHEKDLKWGSASGNVKRLVVVDRGLEVAMKLGKGWPRAKWRQTSKYRRPDGGNGKITIYSTRIAPSTAPDCKIALVDLQADDYYEGFQVWGKLRVK